MQNNIRNTNLPSYMMFPRFLLDMEINETAKMLYIILLDRARLSQKNEGWSDIDGHVFIYFTIEALAEVQYPAWNYYSPICLQPVSSRLICLPSPKKFKSFCILSISDSYRLLN